MKKLVLSLLLFPSFPCLALADGLDKTIVPEGARWLIHVDIEQLTQSTIFKNITELEDVDLADLDEFKAKSGMDPFKDFRAVTVFGMHDEPERAVVAVKTTERVDTALDRMRLMPEYESRQAGPYELHTFDDDFQMLVFRPQSYGDRIVLISESERDLVHGMDVLRGQASNLADANRTEFSANPSPGSVLFGIASQGLMGLGDLEPASAIARLAQHAMFDFGEDRGDIYAHVKIQTSDPKETRRIQQVLQGATALVGLVAIEEPEVGETLQGLVDSLRFYADGNTLSIDFRHSAAELFEQLKALEEKEHGGRHRERKERKVREESKSF